MRYFFPIHLDGGNRGCEAIAKSTALLIGEKPERLFGYCRDTELDTKLGLNQYMKLVPCKRFYPIDKFIGAINKLFHTEKTEAWRQLYPFKSFLHLITKDDIVVSTGGDMLCYDNNAVVYTTQWAHRHHVKSILWGGSMGPENQTKEKLLALSRFSLIYVRESLTYDYFKSIGFEKNLCCLPDPAFILPAEACEVPAVLSGNKVVGLNVSNYVTEGMSLESRFGQEITQLIDYILNETDLQILLVPHVTWNDGGVNQDDRQMARTICNHYNDHPRLHILDIDNLNYCQIRYVISRCRMFVGARTHAVISAYSMCVPTIALGYSIKSRGIAKDLGLDEALVVNSKDFTKGTLLQSFQYLMQHEEAIRSHLLSVMPEYRQRPYKIREYLKQIEQQSE